jgi:hypothetical protein
VLGSGCDAEIAVLSANVAMPVTHQRMDCEDRNAARCHKHVPRSVGHNH